MFTILLHTSKTMRSAGSSPLTTTPCFLPEARELARYVASLEPATIAHAMHISPKLADTTHKTMAAWTDHATLPAIDAFIGDIYSGFQAASLDTASRTYAQSCLVILSGLYGLLRPLDAVAPYRLELGYKFPDPPYRNLYEFWGDRLARALPAGRTIINTSSAEYVKAVLPYLPHARAITPRFLTVSPKTGSPVFVTVHAKISRGAFARWLIDERIDSEARLKDFTDLGYLYDPSLSTELEPVYVAREFKGLGLSVRLT